jgi:hypothetical protein
VSVQYLQGAENGTRTRDLLLGKEALYQLSYFRTNSGIVHMQGSVVKDKHSISATIRPMAFQDFYNDPDFRRQSNAAADTGLKFLGSALTNGAMALFNFLKSMVMMALGK